MRAVTQHFTEHMARLHRVAVVILQACNPTLSFEGPI